MNEIQQTEAERSVLGACLLNSNVVEDVLAVLGDGQESFLTDGTLAVYKAIVALSAQNKPIDLVTVCAAMDQAGSLKPAGGHSFVAGLTDAVPTSHNARHYAELLHEEARKRRIVRACNTVMSNIAKGEMGAMDAMASLENELTLIAHNRPQENVRHVSDVLPEVFRDIQRRRESKDMMEGIPTGIAALDDAMLGLKPGTLNIIGARPSVGKSALAANLAYNAAQHGHPVLFFSLEMRAGSVVRRMMSIDRETPFKRFCMGDPTAMNEALSKCAMAFGETHVYIDDTPHVGMWHFRSKVRKFRRQFRDAAPLVILDYLQLMDTGPSGKRNRYEAVGEISRETKVLAGEMDLPVVMLVQLGREADHMDDPFRCLSLIRESGNIEQDTDTCMIMLKRSPEYVTNMARGYGIDEDHIVNFALAKNRDGDVAHIPLWFHKPTQRIKALRDFRTPAHSHPEPEPPVEEESDGELF